jgi:hypothetical protein
MLNAATRGTLRFAFAHRVPHLPVEMSHACTLVSDGT